MKLSDHLPQGFPLYSPAWTETGADCGDLMLKVRHRHLPAGQCIPSRLLMVTEGDGATRKLCILNCHCWYLQVWQPASIPNATPRQLTHRHARAYINLHLTRCTNRHEKNGLTYSMSMMCKGWQCSSDYDWWQNCHCHSHGWMPAYNYVPLYKVMPHWWWICEAVNAYKSHHLHWTCWTAPTQNFMLHYKHYGQVIRDTTFSIDWKYKMGS